MSWLGYDETRESSIWLSEDGQGIGLMTKSGDVAMVSWYDGSVTRRQPWSFARIHNAPRIWLALAALFFIRFLVPRDSGLVRLSIDFASVASVMFACLIWGVWEETDSRIIDFYMLYGRSWTLLRASMFALFSMLLAWITLAYSSKVIDAIWVAFGLLAIAITITLTYGTETELLTRTSIGLGTGLIVMFVVMAYRGFRLKPMVDPDADRQWKCIEGRAQFRIGDLFFCVSFVAFFAAAHRLHLHNELSSQWELYRYLEGGHMSSATETPKCRLFQVLPHGNWRASPSDLPRDLQSERIHRHVRPADSTPSCP
jgi:hypothetical protein